ncbi:MAG: zinc-binding dehydrogenase, partial [Deltaproteobacteria bacterium]|nr:zinc-binding dehydrogenase [Deltaproteobacteria bacterium]
MNLQEKIKSGRAVVGVIGLGLLGQLGVRMLKAYGHPVIAFDISAERVADAKKGGADMGVVASGDSHENALNAFTDGHGVDAVLIYAAAKDDKPLKLAVDIARKEGRIVQIGNILTQIPWRDFYKKELTYLASTSYGPGRYDTSFEEGGNDYPVGFVRWTERRNMEEFLRLLADKKITLEGLVSGVFPIERAEEAYGLVFRSPASAKGATAGKQLYGILLSYPGDAR